MTAIVLSGPPGVGKTTVGARLAASLEVAFVDLDDLVTTRTGRSPAAWLEGSGEAAFRKVEGEIFAALLDERKPSVIACGGGTLLDRKLRFRALDEALVVSLSAREETLARRLEGGPARPLLAGGVEALTRLLEARRDVYAECHVSIATDEGSPDDAADAIVPWTRRHLVAMPLGARSYVVELVIGDPTRAVDRLAALGPSSVIAVTDAKVTRAHGKALDHVLAPLSVPRVDAILAAGEVHKTLGSVSTIWDAALGAGLDRDAVVLAFGGGVVLDLAGFAAATLLRGIRWVACPTTVLATIDASVGGKTGFDHPAGKNLVGAFHQPSAVIADLSLFATLSPCDRASGLAEAVKIALTSDATLFARLEENATALREGHPESLLPVIAAAVAAKARIVRDDEHERGDRALLNLGHTVGHGLEVLGNYTRWQHGEAVALGLVAELRASAKLGRTPSELTGRATKLLDRLGLPTALSKDDLIAALPRMRSDKKRRGAHLRFPVVTGLGVSEVAHIELTHLEAALLP